jgi:hypothetical protein
VTVRKPHKTLSLKAILASQTAFLARLPDRLRVSAVKRGNVNRAPVEIQ